MKKKDDWRAETQLLLERSDIYRSLKVKCQEEDAGGKQVLALVDDAVYYSYERTKLVLRHMGEFTLHDGDHLFRVLFIMEKLLGDLVDSLSVPELLLLILTAFFHDIGMAPSEAEVIAWKKYWDRLPSFDNDFEKNEHELFSRFCAGHPDTIAIIKNFVSKGQQSSADLIKSYLISDYIRSTHAERALNIIEMDWKERIRYRDSDLISEFAQLCRSHNEEPRKLQDLELECLCGTDVFACLPLVGISLRLADILDFDAKRTPSVLFAHLSVKHPISIKEWNKHRSVEAWVINSATIQFHAKCTHPAIEASVHAFCEMIDSELSQCNNLLRSVNQALKQRGILETLNIPFQVDRGKIETKKDLHGKPIYLYRPTQFRLSKTQVIDLLMGTKLYGNPDVALRELIQNSIDACLLRSALEKKWGNAYYHPEITVRYYSENGDDILEVVDNGTGMDQEIIDNYYTSIGSSFYKSSEFYELRAQSGAEFTPTSRFGIGILSCFMVADTLIVETRRLYKPHSSSEPIKIVVEGQESIFVITPGELQMPGTTTKLILRKETNPWKEMSEDEFIESVENTVLNPPFNINVGTASKMSTRDEKTFAIRSASSIKDYSWRETANIREFEIDLNDVHLGLSGSAFVALLEEKKKPVRIIERPSKSVEIENETYELEKKIVYGDNSIDVNSMTISIDEDGKISKDPSISSLRRSQSRVALHGIEVPHNLFPRSWEKKANLASINWPFPLLLVLDVGGGRDLDLNSARTQILVSDSWVALEEDLAFIICDGIKSQVNQSYWTKLSEYLEKQGKGRFLTGLRRAL